jgi:hypothetical protein
VLFMLCCAQDPALPSSGSTLLGRQRTAGGLAGALRMISAWFLLSASKIWQLVASLPTAAGELFATL